MVLIKGAIVFVVPLLCQVGFLIAWVLVASRFEALPKWLTSWLWLATGLGWLGNGVLLYLLARTQRQCTRGQQTLQANSSEMLQNRAQELAELNRALTQANATLQERNQELDQFAYAASHDLKAPLRAIANLSEWIEEDLVEQLSAENRQQMALLRSRVRRMEALINGLLDYSRLGRTSTPIEVVNLRKLLTEVLDSLSPDPQFTVHLPSDLPTLQTRRLALRQIFANLLSNAIKHHDRPNGQVWITARLQDRAEADHPTHYEFTVQDDGPGIDPSYHNKIFLMFQTLEARDTYENTGVGLAIVKKIVELEGGQIDLISEPSQGAAFRFTWPIVPPVQAN